MRLNSHPSFGWIVPLLLSVLVLQPTTRAIDLDINNEESIRQAARTAAAGMTAYYVGHLPGETPGDLPSPYYWWEAGAMFGALIDYWFYTGDATWNAMTIQALLHQASPTNNFMPPNQTKTEGNDDQGFWAMAAMAAAERNFPNPPPDKPQWLALAQGVFNSQAVRWDTETCAGGLKWQIFRWNRGYHYKNTISNGCFFNLAARLALYTGNETYAEWATKSWEWTKRVNLITHDYQFFDGSDDLLNCTEVNRMQWTYNAGVHLLGAASMYNFTNGNPVWRERVDGIVKGLHTFFYNNTNVMYELTCEPTGNCLVDQRSFKAYLARWMAATTQLAPFTKEMIMPKLRASAVAAARACTGGADGNTCGLRWTTGGFDGSTGVGEQMAALEIFQSNLIHDKTPPVTQSTGGTSPGDPNAGSNDLENSIEPLKEITKADVAGAWTLTAVLIVALIGGAYFAISD